MDIDEIADLGSWTVEIEWETATEPFDENRDYARIWRAWILSRPKNIEKAQADRRHAKRLPRHVRVELRRRLVRAIRR